MEVTDQIDSMIDKAVCAALGDINKITKKMIHNHLLKTIGIDSWGNIAPKGQMSDYVQKFIQKTIDDRMAEQVAEFFADSDKLQNMHKQVNNMIEKCMAEAIGGSCSYDMKRLIEKRIDPLIENYVEKYLQSDAVVKMFEVEFCTGAAEDPDHFTKSRTGKRLTKIAAELAIKALDKTG